ncbi:MAG: SH3 domain-containing protein [Clostridia bacterium]|nr:SH3 domain-containing protein [Clostridia bacterium]
MKMRIISALLVLSLAICPITFAEEASEIQTKGSVALGFVSTQSSNGTVWLRSGGGMSYPAIGYGTNGDTLIVHRTGTYWYRVTLTSGTCKGMTGWMYKRYINTVSLKSKTSKNGWGAMARIRDKYSEKDIRLRSGPGSWYSSRASVDFDDPIIILSKATSSWYIAQLGYTRKYGYIYKPFIANGSWATALTGTTMYRKARATSAVLDYIDEGEQFLVMNVQTKWSKIKFEGTTGYIRNTDYDFEAYIPVDDVDDAA